MQPQLNLCNLVRVLSFVGEVLTDDVCSLSFKFYFHLKVF
jgi:hypothetical protein